MPPDVRMWLRPFRKPGIILLVITELEDYTATEKMIIIKIKDDKWDKYRVQFIGKGEDLDKCGRLLKEDVDNPATYQIEVDEGYVRAKVIDSNGKVAWTQPVMIGKP